MDSVNIRTANKTMTSTQSALESRVANLERANRSLASTQSALESRVVYLEETNRSLSLALSRATAENIATENDKPSTFSMLCEKHNIREFPENPAEALRGLLSEFDIKESSTEIIRDVRDNP